MLNGGCNDMDRLLLLSKVDTLQGLIASFASAAGEDDFIGLSAKQISDLLTGAIERIVSSPTIIVSARGIAETIAEVEHDRVHHGGVHWRGGVVIEVDGGHWADILMRAIGT